MVSFCLECLVMMQRMFSFHSRKKGDRKVSELEIVRMPKTGKCQNCEVYVVGSGKCPNRKVSELA